MKQRTKIEKRVVANSRRCRKAGDTFAQRLDEQGLDMVMFGSPENSGTGLCGMMNAMGWHWVETRSIPEPKQARSPYTPEDGENHG